MTVDRWQRLGSEILSKNFILTWNHGFSSRAYGVTDVSLAVAFSHIKTWADSSDLIINLERLKNCFYIFLVVASMTFPSLEGIEQLWTVKLLTVIF